MRSGRGRSEADLEVGEHPEKSSGGFVREKKRVREDMRFWAVCARPHMAPFPMVRQRKRKISSLRLQKRGGRLSHRKDLKTRLEGG